MGYTIISDYAEINSKRNYNDIIDGIINSDDMAHELEKWFKVHGSITEIYDEYFYIDDYCKIYGSIGKEYLKRKADVYCRGDYNIFVAENGECFLRNNYIHYENESGKWGNNISWILDGEGKLIISGNGVMDEYFVDSFENPENILEIVIENGVSSIGRYAFDGFSNLTKIQMADSVASIGEYAFEDCTGLNTVELPRNLTSIGEGAFKGCTALFKVNIPDNITLVPDKLFYNCANLQLIYWNSAVTDIGDYAFYNCSGLSSVVLPESVEFIGKKAFYNCTGAESFLLNEKLTGIDDYAFSNCKSLLYIDIPDGVNYIGAGAFETCEKLTEVSVGGGLNELADSLFRNCTQLKNIIIGSNVKIIGKSAFEGCRGLVSADIKNTAVIKDNAFYNCSALKKLTLHKTLEQIGESAFRYCKELNNITIPDSTTTIGTYAFADCTGLQSINLGNGLTSISNYMLKGCTSLNEVVFGNKTERIGDYSFSGCSSIENIVFNNALLSIGNYAFNNCTKLARISLPDNTETVGNGAFYNCTGLTEAFLGRLGKLGSNMFSNCTSLTDVVITNIDEIGSSAFSNCLSLERISLPYTLTKINNGAFRECKNLSEIVLPDSVTYVGSETFYNCSSLKRAVIGKGISVINSYTFYGCSGLASIDLTGIRQIGSSAFCNCIALTSLTIPDSVEDADSYSFYGCTGLENVIIEDGLSDIENGMFQNCTSLSDISLSSKVATIGNSAFRGCSSLKSIYLPNSVTSIYSYAFYNCTKLTDITIGSGIKSIGSYTFYGCAGLSDVFFSGSEDLWKNVSIGSSNGYLTNAKKHYVIDLTIITNGNGTANKMGTYYPGDLATVIAVPYEGEEFLGWYVEGALVSEDKEYSFEAQSDVQLQGKFTDNTCSVSFTDGIDVLQITRILKGTCAEIPDEIKKDGYIFIGFYADENYDTPINKNETYNSDTTIYVKYSPIQRSDDFLWYENNGAVSIISYESNGISELIVPCSLGGYPVERIETNAFSAVDMIDAVYIPHTITYIGENIFSNSIDSIKVYFFGSREQWDNIMNEPNYVLEKSDIVCNLCIMADVSEINYYSEYAKLGVSVYTQYIIDDCVAYVDIYNANEQHMCTYGPFDIYSGSPYVNLELDFEADNKEYTAKVSFYHDDTKDVTAGMPVSFDFFAEKETFRYDEYYYQMAGSDSVEIIGMADEYYNVFVPEIINNYSVVSISEDCFRGNECIETVLIPESVKNIGDFAFSGCRNLRTVYYTGNENEWDSIAIGDGNSALEWVEKIYDYSDFVIGHLDELGYDGTAVTGRIYLDFVYKDCVAEIRVLDESGNVEKESYVNIYAGMNSKQFGFTFESDNKIHIINIIFISDKDSQKLYGNAEIQNENNFFYAEKQPLYEQDFAYSVCDSGVEIKWYQGNQSTVIIPETLVGSNVIGIGSYAFDSDTVKSIIIPSTVSYISNRAFADSGITEITIPDNITSIGDYAFDCCYGLSSINVTEGNPNYCSIDGNLYSKDKTELIRYAIAKEAAEFVIPDTVTKIHPGAFADAENLEKITLPSSLKEIEDYAFSYSFIREIKIPKTVIDIGRGVFAKCQSLETITVDIENPAYCDVDGILYNKDHTALMQYPCGKAEADFKILNGVEKICAEAFNGSRLQTIVIPKTVTDIESNAMNYMRSLCTVLYSGGQEEWESLANRAALRNEALLQSKIIFDYNENLQVYGELMKCYYDNGVVIAEVGFDYIEKDCKAIFAIYDEEGKLVTLTSKDISRDAYTETLSCPADEKCIGYQAKVFFWDGWGNMKPIGNALYENVTDIILESLHPYDDNCDETQLYTYNGECESISITFSEDTQTERNYDYIYIYDMNDNEIGRYSGSELAGRTVNVPGNVVKIRLTSDGSNTDYGYRVERIDVNKQGG